MPKIEEVPLDSIKVPEVRASAKMTPEQEEFFRRTAEEYGILQPIIVNRLAGGNYRLLAGKKRLEELKKQGEEKTQAVVVELEGLDETMVHLAENLARGEVDPASVCELVRKAHDEGASVEDIADSTGHTTNWVKLYLMASELPDEYTEDLREGRLKIGHIRESLKLPTPQDVAAALDSARVHSWTVDQLKNYVNSRLTEIREAEIRGESEVIEEPPTEEKRVKMARYRICNACRNHVKAEETTMYLLCKDCVKLLKYVISQVGPPDKAIDEIYKAISHLRSKEVRPEVPQLPASDVVPVPKEPLPAAQQPQRQVMPSAEKSVERFHGLPKEETETEEKLTPEEIKLLKSIAKKLT